VIVGMSSDQFYEWATCFPLYYIVMRAERPILLRFLNVLTSLNGFIINRIVFLFLVIYIASGTLMCQVYSYNPLAHYSIHLYSSNQEECMVYIAIFSNRINLLYFAMDLNV
jgi:hypothetical protein